MGSCGLSGNSPIDLTNQQNQKINTNKPLIAPQTMIHHHIASNISDSEKQRLFLQTSWKKYYPSFVSKHSQNRNKFVCFQTLCHNLKIDTVENTEHRIYDKHSQQCVSIHILFHITFSTSYRKQTVHLSACIEFNDAVSIFDDNPFNTKNMHWKQNIIVLEPIINTKKPNKSMHIIHDNDIIDDKTCSVLQQNILNINENDGLIHEYFTLFWQWFTSKEVIQFKDKNVALYETSRDTKKDNKDNICLKREQSNLSEREVIDTIKGPVEDTNDEKMNENTKQFYIFLQQNGLQQYFDKFKANNCSDIGYISVFIKKENYLQNKIGIKDEVHRARFIRECQELERQKHEFKQMIPSLLFQKLSKNYGIITVNILCNQVKNINDLKYKYQIRDDGHCNLLWNVIEREMYPQNMQYQYSTEGTQHDEPGVLSAEEQAFPSQFI